MARIGHKYIEASSGKHAGIDSNVEEFKDTMGYQRLAGFASRAEFLSHHCSAPWLVQVRQALKQILRKGRHALVLGSGIGEHEVPLLLEGYDVTASDVIPHVLEKTQSLFPELKTRAADVFALGDLPGVQDIVDGGILFYFDDTQALRAFTCVFEALPNGGRLVTLHRYNDNVATSFLDRILLPLEARLKNAIHFLRGSPVRFSKKAHGFRRSRAEIVSLARKAGFQCRRVRFAGFGVEATRSALFSRLKGFLLLAELLDRWVPVFNNVTIFEFEKVGRS